MRIWDVEPSLLCRNHLLGEHAELHGLWNVLTLDREGYRSHPETRRWKGKLGALFRRHDALVTELDRRGYRHRSPLDPALAVGAERQDELLHSVEEQKKILTAKACGCLRSQENGGREGSAPGT